MWSAIRSDLTEFASSIATDSNQVIGDIESKLIEDNGVNEQDGDDQGRDHNERNKLLMNDMEHPNTDDIDRTDGSRGSDAGAEDSILLGEGGEVAYVGGGAHGFASTGIISDAQDEALKRHGEEETYTTPLLRNEKNGVQEKTKAAPAPSASSVTDTTESESDLVPNDHENDQQGTEEGTSDAASDAADGPKEPESQTVASSDKAEEENVQEQHEEEEAYDEDDYSIDEAEVEAIALFLQDFDIESKTDEISTILTTYPETVGYFFENLVPVVVTYEQFWQRYFYRCDPDRIQDQWDEEEERARQERQELIDKGKKTVQNLFGGALNAINRVTKQQDSGKEASIYEKYQAELEQKQKAMMDGGNSENEEKSSGLGLGFFRSAGRPPFVMNTAVDDSAEDESIDEEDESIEEEDDDEFGWGSDEDLSDLDEDDDDDDDDDDSEEENVADVTEEEVIFASPDTAEIENLKEELSQALEERDALQKTVEMQTAQIKEIHENKSGDGTISVSQTATSEESDELENLRLAMFEKDAELGALKASLEDTHEDDNESQKLATKLTEQANTITSLQTELIKKEKELAELHDTSNESGHEESKAMLDEAHQTIESLKTEINQVNELKSKEKTDNESALTLALETVKALQSELDSLNNEKVTNEEEIDRLRKQLETNSDASVSIKAQEDAEAQHALEENSRVIASLKTELEEEKVKGATLTSKMDDLQLGLESLQTEKLRSSEIISELKRDVEIAQTSSKQQLEESRIHHEASSSEKLNIEVEELKAANSQLESDAQNLISEMESSRDAKAEAEKQVLQLKQELENQKLSHEKTMKETMSELEKPTVSPSPVITVNSFSSGEKVNEINRGKGDKPGENEGDEGWGDSWSDDDDDL